MLLVVCGVVGSGCKTYQQQNLSASQHWQQGRFSEAVQEYNDKAKKSSDGKDALIWRLEQATALRSSGQLAESNAAFDAAEALIERYEKAARVRIGQESLAMVSNPANLAYEGRAYDKIMVNTYKALNYLQLHQPDKARVELIRAYNRQQDAVQENRRRLERAGAGSAPEQQQAARAQQDPRFQAQLASTYNDLNRMKVYADYVNPFTVFLDGLFFMYQATGGADLERARKSLERTASFAASNPYIRQDQATLEQMIRGQRLAPITYVIFETGLAPIREQTRIDIPIIVTDVSYIGMAFPKLTPQYTYIPQLQVHASNTTATTSLVASMDSIIGLDFKNELPGVITKTLIAAAAKATASYAINHSSYQADDALGWIARLVTAGYQAAVNIADLRTWTTLPKELQYCRVPTPPDRKIELIVPPASQRILVNLLPGTVNMVYVKSVGPNSPTLVSQFLLK